MPQHDSLLQVQLLHPEKYWLSYMINQYKKHEASLRQHHQDIMSNKTRYLDAAYQQCHAWLPERLRKRNNEAQIYLTALNNDAVAGESAIIMTIWCAYHFDHETYGAIAGHELHHILREPQQFQIVPTDTAIMQVLELILNEGIPDLIDKKLTMAPGFPEELKFGQYLLESGPQVLAQLDSMLIETALNKRQIMPTDISTLAPMSGHIPGFFMADVIQRNGLQKAMIKSAQNPFQFFRLYDKAAKKDKQHPYRLSAKSMEYLDILEKRNPVQHN